MPKPKQHVGNVSVPASAFNELMQAYGLKQKSHLMNECLRQLESTHPSEFKVSWITQWPTRQPERVPVTKAVPKVLWELLSTKWGMDNASELLRYGLYIMYAKRFDCLSAQDKQLEDDVRRGMELLKQRREQEKTLGYDSFPPVSAALASNNDDADTKELKLVTELEQQAVLPTGLETVKEGDPS